MYSRESYNSLDGRKVRELWVGVLRPSRWGRLRLCGGHGVLGSLRGVVEAGCGDLPVRQASTGPATQWGAWGRATQCRRPLRITLPESDMRHNALWEMPPL